jgi:hypothetical protein
MSRRSDKREKLARQQRENDLRWLLSHPQGRRIVAERIEASGMDIVSPFTGNSSTFWNMGRHDFMRQWANEMKAVALADFRRMEDEFLSASKIAEQERNLPDDNDAE